MGAVIPTITSEGIPKGSKFGIYSAAETIAPDIRTSSRNAAAK